MTTGRLQEQASEVAELMASRFGGARRGEAPTLQTMMRRRGASLPRKLRRQAIILAEADGFAASPKIARQLDPARLDRAHQALVAHLKPLGAQSRLITGATNIAASIIFGLLLMAACLTWFLVWRGLI